MEEMNEMVDKLYQVIDSSNGGIDNLLKDIFHAFELRNGILFFHCAL
jgi:hypothetical protein